MLLDRSDIQSILDSVPDRRVSGFQLNSLRLPPSPSLEIPAHQQSSLELFHALSFAPSGSRGCSEEPISWHLCSQASAQTSSPISFEGLESSSIEYRHQNSHSSLLLSTGFSSSESAAYNIALMTSSGLETPPGSARSSMTELDRQPHPYTHPPTALHGDYLSPNDTMYPPPRDHGRGAPRDIPYPTYNTSTHQSHGGG